MQVRHFSSALILASLLAASTSFAAPSTVSTTSKNAPVSTQPASTSNSAQAADNQAVDINKVSFSIGYTMGTNLIEQFKQLNQSELLKGFQQGLSGAESAISKEDMQKLLISFQRQAMQQQFEDLKKLALTNKQEGDKFLAENKN